MPPLVFDFFSVAGSILVEAGITLHQTELQQPSCSLWLGCVVGGNGHTGTWTPASACLSTSEFLGESHGTGTVQVYAIHRTSSIFNVWIWVKSTTNCLPLPCFVSTSFIPVSGLIFHPLYTFFREVGWFSVMSMSPSDTNSFNSYLF